MESAIEEDNELKRNKNNTPQKRPEEDDSGSSGKKESQKRIQEDDPENISKNARKRRLEKEKNQSAIFNVVECHQDEDMNISLDVRDMVTSPDNKYLITCSETDQGEIPKVYVWNLDNILQGEKNAKGHPIEIQQKGDEPNLNRRINWLLAVDVETVKVGGMEKWIICAGGLNGDIYLWSGDIESNTKEWMFNLKTDIFKKLPIDAGNHRAVFKVKIIKQSPLSKNLEIYIILNTIQGKIQPQSNEYCIKKYPITFNDDGYLKDYNDEYKGVELKGHFADEHGNEGQNTDCLLVCDFCKDHKFLISGTRNNTIIKWDLISNELADEEQIAAIYSIGNHEDAVTSIRIFKEKIKKEEIKKEKGKKDKGKKNEKLLKTEEFPFEDSIILVKEKENMRTLYHTKEYEYYLKLIKSLNISQIHAMEVLDDLFNKDNLITIEEKENIRKISYYQKEKAIVIKSVIDEGTFENLEKLVKKYGWFFYRVLIKEKYKLASGSLDGVIKIWDLKAKTSIDLGRHSNEIVSLELLIGENFLVSASKDNTIKIWDLGNRVLVRNIDLDYEIDLWNKKNRKEDQFEFGLDFLKKIILTNNNQYILALKKNKIFVIRNFGRIWHFYRQLKYIKDDAHPLYEKIFGENLRQIAKWRDEKEKTLEVIFKIIKDRLTPDSATASPDSEQHNLGELGELFIPSFIRFEAKVNQQKEYIKSVQTNYDNYWYSANKMFIQAPKFSWRFRFFLTTGKEKNFKDSKYIELKKDNSIILKDRKQSQVRFLMVLDNIPATFIPLLKAINMEVEDDRGDKDTLIFTDFKYSDKGNIKILEDKSSKKFVLKPTLSQSYFSVSTFKLDERYSRDNYANVYIKKISLEYTESLNPLKSSGSLPQDKHLFEAFRDNFNYPDMEKIQIKIGNNLISAAGKLLDQYLAEFIMLEFIFTMINILMFFDEGITLTVVGQIAYGLNILVSVLIGALIIFPFIKKVMYDKIKNRSSKKKANN